MSISTHKTVIVSVIYQEKGWSQTKLNIRQCDAPVVYVDRNGTGSLAKALNVGFKKAIELYDFKYVWFVTNPTFKSSVFRALTKGMEKSGYAAIHPSFNSDHKHIRQDDSGQIKPVPFIEFTAPMVRRDVFEQFPLDEDMPYWGHDLDWSYRVRQAGYTVAVDHAIKVKHVYIRNSTAEAVTQERKRNRKRTNASTLEKIQSIYGEGESWRDSLGYYQ